MSPAFSSALRTAFWTLTALALPACALTTVAYFTSTPTLFAQLSPFRLQYAALLTAHVLFCLALRHRRWAAFFALFAVFNLWAILRASPPQLLQATRADTPPVKVLLANVLTSNPDPSRLLALIAEEKPDVVALLEVNRRWERQLSAALLGGHPHTLLSPREDNFGLAVFSRLPLADTGSPLFVDPELPSLEFTVSPSGRADDRIRILVTHPLPPGSADSTMRRDEQLDRIAVWTPRGDTPALVLGDLNATPWCPPLRRLLSGADLRTASSDQARFSHRTWPVPIPFLGIPLDHALLNSALTCTSFRAGPDIGSDHFPIIAELRATAPFPP